MILILSGLSRLDFYHFKANPKGFAPALAGRGRPKGGLQSGTPDCCKTFASRPCYRPARFLTEPALSLPSLPFPIAPIFQCGLLAKYHRLKTGIPTPWPVPKRKFSEITIFPRTLSSTLEKIFFVFLSRPRWPLVLYGCKALKGRTFPDESGFSISDNLNISPFVFSVK